MAKIDVRQPPNVAADTAVAAHAAASDPHTGYQKESELDVVGGYSSFALAIKAARAPAADVEVTRYWSYPVLHSTAATVAGFMYCHSFLCPYAMTLDRIGAEVTGAGAGGSTVSLGIYLDDGNGQPGALLLDAGTIAGDSATAQEKTISQALVAGRLYWLAALVLGGTPTMRTMHLTSGSSWRGEHYTTLASALGTTALKQGRSRGSLASTSLPDPAATTSPESNIPIIAIRRSA